jgi:hypothetical protein
MPWYNSRAFLTQYVLAHTPFRITINSESLGGIGGLRDIVPAFSSDERSGHLSLPD